MPRLEQGSANSTDQTKEGINIYKEHEHYLTPYEQQRATGKDITRGYTKNEIQSPINDTEIQQKLADKMHKYVKELTKTTDEIKTLPEKYAILSHAKKDTVLKEISESSTYIILENKKEMEEKEPLFQELKSEIKEYQRLSPLLDRWVEDTKTYHKSLEQVAQTSPHMQTTTHPLRKQLLLLDTAIASLHEEMESKQDALQALQENNTMSKEHLKASSHGITHEHISSEIQQIQRKLKEFTTQKQMYEDMKKSHTGTDAHIPELEKQLSEQQTFIDQREDELSEINHRLEEIRTLHHNVEKEKMSPQLVTQNFVEQLSMVEDHIRYLEREIKATQEHSTVHTSADKTKTPTETISPHEKLTALNNTLTTEKAYLKDLLAGKVERSKSNRDIVLQAKKELDIIGEEIEAFKIINNLFQQEKARLQPTDPDAREIMQKIDQHLAQNENFLAASQDCEEMFKDHLENHQTFPASLEALTHGIYTQQELSSTRENVTIKIGIKDQERVINEKINLMKEAIATINALRQKRSREKTKRLVSHRDTPTMANLDLLLNECHGQMQAGENYRDYLTGINEKNAQEAIVHRPIDEQISMVQDLQKLHAHYEPNLNRSLRLENYQRKLAELRQRPQKTLRATGTNLKTQIELVKDHISFLQAESERNTAHHQSSSQNDARTKNSTMLAAETKYLQDLTKLDALKIRSQAMVTRDIQKQATMLHNLILHMQTQRTEIKDTLLEAQRHKDDLLQRIQNISSKQVQVSLALSQQRELVDLNLQHLTRKSTRVAKTLQEKESAKESLQARLIDLTYCNDLLSNNDLTRTLTQTDATDQRHFQFWTKYKNSLQERLQKLPQGPSDKAKEALTTQTNRIQSMVEKLEANWEILNGKFQDVINMQQSQERAYAEALDQQRDHLHALRKKTEAIVNQHAKRVANHRKLYHHRDPKQIQAMDKKMAEIQVQVVSSITIRDQIDHQMKQVTAKIQTAHENLKDLAEIKDENTHPYFLSEHVIPQEALIKFGFPPISSAHLFTGTMESACIPTVTRMICYDRDPSFAAKTKEVAEAFHRGANGGAHLHEIPKVLSKMGHPIPYKTEAIRSTYELLDKVHIDKWGNPLPTVIGIHRPDKPHFASHVIICDRIIELNGHTYGVIRDPSASQVFAVRLEHIDEVLVGSHTSTPALKNPGQPNVVVPREHQ